MSLISDGVIYIIDSSKRIGGTNADFTFNINIPRDQGFDRVCLLQAIIPKSYYLVNAPYNQFILRENGVDTSITVPEGNYNVRTWISIVGGLLNTHSSQGWQYTITFPNEATELQTGKFTITVTNNIAQPSIIFPVNSVVYEQFGFVKESTNTFIDNSLVSSNVIKFQTEDVLFLHSTLSKNNDQTAYTSVLQEIYASSTPPFTNIVYQNYGKVEAYSRKLASDTSNVYSFQLTDENNRTINLRGLNCVFTILIYRKDNINKLIAQSLLRNQYLQ